MAFSQPGADPQPQRPCAQMAQATAFTLQYSLKMAMPNGSNAEAQEENGSESDDYGTEETVTTTKSGIWAHLNANVRPTIMAELELILLTVCTGIQDAVSFPDYHCFASNQTGNTVFLMLAILLPRLNGEMFIAANIGTALGFFLLAGWLTGQLGHLLGPRRRYWLVACNLMQSLLVFTAAAIQHRSGVELTGRNALCVLGLVAFASGSQVVQSRSLAMTEISTAMATAAWVDLMIDPRLFTLDNRPRSRRVFFLASLVLGVVLGAVIYRSVGSSVAMFVSAGGKALVAFLYLFNEAEVPVLVVSKA